MNGDIKKDKTLLDQLSSFGKYRRISAGDLISKFKTTVLIGLGWVKPIDNGVYEITLEGTFWYNKWKEAGHV